MVNTAQIRIPLADLRVAFIWRGVFHAAECLHSFKNHWLDLAEEVIGAETATSLCR